MGQSRKFFIPFMLVFLAIALFAAGCAGEGDTSESRIAELEEQNAVLQSDNEELQNTVASLEAQIEELQDSDVPVLVINRKPKEGWEDYFPTAETTTLEGESVEKVRGLVGEPPFLIRSNAVVPEASREIWIFVPYDKDPTGLYIYFKGGQLHSSRLDEFNGLYGSGLLDDDSFWY